MVLSERIDAVVLGAGVSGLTTAVVLAEAGLSTRILAELPPARTSSAKAGASWGPMMVGGDPLLSWSRETFTRLAELAAKPDSGVRLLPGTEAFEEPVTPPVWAIEVADYRRGLPPDLPACYVDGWRYTIPIVDMPTYLDYLSDRFTHAGGTMEIGRRINDLEEVRTDAYADSLLVNCTGLGSRVLLPDTTLRPSRGQLVLVSNPGIHEFFQDNPLGNDLTYILPHEEYVVLGGHANAALHDLRPDPLVARAILARCRAVDPRLHDAQVIGHRVGLRPTRPTVHLGWDGHASTPVLHNYGHGGSGLTLSWGCAFEVLRLALVGRVG